MNNPLSGNKRGYLLPMVIIYMIIAMIVGAGILHLGTLARIEANKRLHREQAFYLAEAGINLARFNLKNSGSWQPTNPYPLGAGNFQLLVDNTTSNTMIFVTSTGTVKGITETISATFTNGSGGGGGVFSHGVFGKSKVYLGPAGSSQIAGYDSRTGAVTDAWVGSNSSIEIDSSGRIFGNASVATAGGIDYPDWAPNAITGTKIDNAAPQTLPDVIIPPDLLSLPYTQTGITGTYQFTNGNFTMNTWPRVAGITSGNYRFRSLSILSDAQLTITGTVRLYIENQLSITGNSKFILQSGNSITIYMGGGGEVTIDNSAGNPTNHNNNPANLAIYVAGNRAVNMPGNARITAAIYAPNSIFTIDNSSELRGGIVANRINAPGNARIYADAALQEVPPPGDPGGSGSGEIDFVSWTKPDWKK